MIRFLLYAFFVRINLNNPHERAAVDINRRIEKMRVTICDINVFISLRFIHKLAKNFTSSIVFALSTINAIKAPQSTRLINNIAPKKPNIIHRDVFFISFFFFILVSSTVLNHIFSPFSHGAVFAESLKLFAPTFTSHFHS